MKYFKIDLNMNNAFLRKSLSFFQIISDYIRHLVKQLNYLGIIALGLSLGKFTNMLFLFYFSGSLGENLTTQQYKPIKENVLSSTSVSASVDPLQIIGGVLFAPEPLVEEEVEEEVPKEELKDYLLRGTVSGHFSFARAVIQVFGEKVPVKEYATWQKIGPDRILWIGREHIIVKRKDKRIKLKVGEKISQIVKESLEQEEKNKKTESKVSDKSSGDVIKKVLSRQEVNKMLLGNPAKIYKGASFGPVLENNNITGYKVYKVKSSHFFYKLGARSGDIVRKVNDYELSDTERMFELWKSMKTADRVKVELERRKKIIKYDFSIQN